MRGNLSGRQNLTYDGSPSAYDTPVGEVTGADNYNPRVIAKVMREPYANRLYYFQVRTRSTVNMTATMHHNMALMGGSGALFAALLRQKTSNIYKDCMRVCPKRVSLRAFLLPLLRAGLAAKNASITIDTGVVIVNPWVSSDTPNVPVPQTILDKFASELSNS